MSSTELGELIGDIVARAEPGATLWPTLEELGLTLVGVPEHSGGSGGTLQELADVAEALGAHGVAAPVIERATSAWSLAMSGQELVAGATIALVADASIQAVPAVPWVEGATHLIVAHLAEGTAAVLDLAAPGVEIGSTVDFAGVPVSPVRWSSHRAPLALSVDGAAMAARVALLRVATVAGAARSAYQLTRQHVRTREQFGRPLVALAAVKTALARMRVQLIQLDTAMATAREQAEGARAFTSAVAARIVAAAAATELAHLAHQLHGAIGITQEYALHPLTCSLWAGRDIDLPEDLWARILGDYILDRGEPTLWDITGVA